MQPYAGVILTETETSAKHQSKGYPVTMLSPGELSNYARCLDFIGEAVVFTVCWQVCLTYVYVRHHEL